MNENLNQIQKTATLTDALNALKDNINYNLNCVKVATVDDFNADTLICKCRINNKKILGLKADGNQILQDYPPIYAKTYFMGWGPIGITYPIYKGMEGILLFNDRELESWNLTGEANGLAYDRCHDLSDAIFLCGVRSVPHLQSIATNALCIYYGEGEGEDAGATSMTFAKTTIGINGDIAHVGDTTHTGDVTASGTIKANKLISDDGATGSFRSQDNKTITVRNGIITGIQ